MFKSSLAFKTHLRRASVLGAALLLGVSLSACGGASTESGKTKESKAASGIENKKLTKADFKVLNGKKIGPVTASVHELTAQEKQAAMDTLKQMSSMKDQMKVEPKECESLAQQLISPAGQYGDSLENIIIAGNITADQKPNTISLNLAPAQATLKAYMETDKQMVSKCPNYSFQMPGGVKMEFTITPFQVADYNDLASSVNAYQMQSTQTGSQAFIEIVLKNNQTMQVISDTPEHASKTLEDALKLLKLR